MLSMMHKKHVGAVVCCCFMLACMSIIAALSYAADATLGLGEDCFSYTECNELYMAMGSAKEMAHANYCEYEKNNTCHLAILDALPVPGTSISVFCATIKELGGVLYVDGIEICFCERSN